MKLYRICIYIIFTALMAVAIIFNIKTTMQITDNKVLTETVVETIPEPVVKDFSKAVFIGDSRTQGLMMYSGLTDSTFYTGTGLTVRDVVETPIIETDDGEITIIEALKQNNFESIVVMLGINELGWAYKQSFYDAYNLMLTEIKNACPGSEIIVQTIMPVNRALIKNPKDYINNYRIAEFNEIIKEVSGIQNVKCVDTHSIMCDENGDLYLQASSDGIHLNMEFCQRWTKFLKGEKLDEIETIIIDNTDSADADSMHS